MKFLKILLCCSFLICMFNYAKAQPQLATNANINISTANAGVVTQGNTIDLFVSVVGEVDIEFSFRVRFKDGL